jgi:hypothetical protein
MQFPSCLLEVVVSLNILVFLGLISRWLAASSIFSRSSTSKISYQPVLRLNEQNEFHITIFSDLHYGEEEDGWGIDQDVNSARVMNNVLAAEVPDFVILSL